MTGCSSGRYRTEEGMVWNTVYHITYDSDKDLSDSILVIFNEIDNSLSPFNNASVVSKINRNESPLSDSHFKKVFLKSQEINEKTGGMFDPTVAPLIRAWGFGHGHTVTADTLRIDSLLTLVGITKTSLHADSLVKENPNIEFNFSAIAKGYGVDCIADMLKRNGVTNFLVEVGGEIRASGVNPSGDKWTIGIDKPLINESGTVEDIISQVSVTDAGVATSGNYRNYHKDASSATFGHTISPLTGRPIQTDILSATIIAPTCMDADAIATSCMALGLQKSLELCSSLSYAALFVTTDLKVVTNQAFDSLNSK